MKDNTSTQNQRVTQAQKDAGDKAYYRDQLDRLDSIRFSRADGYDGISEYSKMKANYALFNNQIDLRELAYVCQPFGADVGELPAQMTNRDIISGKVKAIMGMEAKRPFDWSVIAVNEEATTRKEQFEFGKIKEFVVSSIMLPIQQKIEMDHAEQTAGQPLTQEQKLQIQEQIAAETKAQTPPEVRKYMARDHQDPAEALARQILEYLFQKEEIKEKFMKGLKHGLISGREVFWVALVNNEPKLRVVNSLAFDYAKSSDIDNIEDAEDAVAEFRMTASQVISQFRDELTDKEINDIYDNYSNGSPTRFWSEENLFTFGDEGEGVDNNTLRVLYGEWVSERKIGYLHYYDQNKEPQMMLVGENYKLNKADGDIKIEWDWIPEVHCGYKVNDLYLGCGPVPGQHNDMDNLYTTKLSFVGVDYDNLNSETTSFVDRLKGYQFYYNVILYRVELLMASDKGKIFMMNINAVPKSSKIDLKKFQHFLESGKIAWYNPNEEANKKGTGDVNTIGKVIDLSLASEISQYIDMAEYIEKKAGRTVGTPEEMLGQISQDASVRNSQMNISQSSNILEPTFQVHNSVKRRVLQRLVDVAKVGYVQGKPRKLTYFLDDLSQAMINLDENAQALLDSSTLGLFISDTTNAFQAKQAVENLAHAAMQTQQIDLLDVVKVLRANGIQEAEENLQVGTDRKADKMAQQAQQAQQAQDRQTEIERGFRKEEWSHDEKMVVLKETERRKTVVQQQTILALGFNEDKDMDGDGTPDVLEVAKFGVDAQIRNRELALKERTQTENNAVAKDKIEVDKEKNKIMKNKASAA